MLFIHAGLLVILFIQVGMFVILIIQVRLLVKLFIIVYYTDYSSTCTFIRFILVFSFVGIW
jgi:hypothetical protein